LIADMPPPWDGFTPDELRAVTEQIVVSHKPDHGTPGSWQQTTGALHNDTAYGIERERAPGKYDVVHRVPLESVKKREDLARVKDKALCQRLMDLWDRTVGSGQRVRDFAVAGRDQLGVKSVRVTEVVSGVAIEDDRQQPYKVYKTDGNAFMDVYRPADGRWRAETVSRFLANQPNAEPNWKRQHPTAKKIARLHVDDLVALGNGDGRRVYRVVKLSGSTAVLAEHHEAGSLKARDADKSDLFQYVNASPSRLQREGFRRLGVDEVGRVRDPGPGR
jgi:CRISPR-associated endonuclease Csn1